MRSEAEIRTDLDRWRAGIGGSKLGPFFERLAADVPGLLSRVQQLTEENAKWRERVNTEHAALQECMEHEVQRIAERDRLQGQSNDRMELLLAAEDRHIEAMAERDAARGIAVELEQENARLWAATDGVRALHRPTGPPDSGKTCIEDGDEWPCRTAAALAAAGAPEPQPPKPLVPPIDWSKVSQKRAT